jgi:uncharacterized membrane protein
VTPTDRYDEIDVARGTAILMMILFHTIFDLAFFGVYPVNVSTGFWRWFAVATASLFLLIAGISLTISHARALQRLGGTIKPPVQIVIKYLKRGAGIFCCGLLVTLATWLYLGDGFVMFGILHLIGVSIMLAPLFFWLRKKNILIGAVWITIGITLAYSAISGPVFLLWLGIHPASFTSVDYTPLFPWFGVVLIGMGLGEHLYPNGKRVFNIPHFHGVVSATIALLGRHSLVIYLVHQPVIILLLHIVAGVRVLG